MMTMLSNKELTKIASNEFILEFLKAELVQQVPENPTVYRGSGSISQDGDGKLQLKMYCPFNSSDEFEKELGFLNRDNGLERGQLIGAHHYFKFEGVDVFGQVWKATDIWLDGDVSFPASGRIVRSDLHSIESRRERQAGSTGPHSKMFVVPGIYRLPFTHGQPGTSEPGFSACTIDLGGGRKCEIKTREAALIVSLDLLESDPENYPQRVLDAIGLGVGAHMVPQVELTWTEKELVQVVRRLDEDSSQHYRIVPPIPVRLPNALAGLQDFIQQYLQRVEEPYSQLAGYWYRILVGFQVGLENQALVLTTAIEGFLKTYFPEHGKADEDFVKQVEEAIPAVNKLEIGERARKRILSNLDNAKAPSPSNALWALAKSGKIPAELVKVWKYLRNKSSHADELKLGPTETQLFVNDLYACLELFYRLIMLHVGFEGRIVRYAKVGWPEQGVADFSAMESESLSTELG